MIAWWLDRMRWAHLAIAERHVKRAKYHRTVAEIHHRKVMRLTARLLALLERRRARK